MKWRIYYDNGAVFSDEEGSAFDAPRIGVQVIVHQEPGGGYSLMSQSDFYYYEPERSDWSGWNYCDQYTLVLHLQRAKQPLILFGSMIKTSQFTEIEKRALSELPGPKKAWRRGQDKQTTGHDSPEPVMP